MLRRQRRREHALEARASSLLTPAALSRLRKETREAASGECRLIAFAERPCVVPLRLRLVEH